MRQFIANLRSEEGATAAEYIFVLVFVAIVVSVGMAALGVSLDQLFDDTATEVDGAGPGTIGG